MVKWLIPVLVQEKHNTLDNEILGQKAKKCPKNDGNVSKRHRSQYEKALMIKSDNLSIKINNSRVDYDP